MERPRTTPVCLALLGLLLFAGPAWAVCPVIQIPPDQNDFLVPPGCHYMIVKIWGGGGNGGFTGLAAGKGGGGAAVTAVFEVFGGEHYRGSPAGQHPGYAGWGSASYLEDMSLPDIDKAVVIAAGGGAGGTNWGAPGSGGPDGGAGGGYVGQDGQDGTWQGSPVAGGGQGGAENEGGVGGGGSGSNNANGKPGGDHPCSPNSDEKCGQGGGSLVSGGYGGLGRRGGGGGGSYTSGTIGVSAGGGGGASYVRPGGRLVYERRYDGNREKPGNEKDPHRHGAGGGGVPAGIGHALGNGGQIFVMFDALDIDPEVTTRWKPMRSDDRMEVVFDSPIELESATLDIKDPDGIPVAVDPQTIQPESAPPGIFRYKLLWNGPWTRSAGQGTERLPAGNYTLVVRGTPVEGEWEMKSAPYDRISLVEVTSVVFESAPGSAPLTPNPTLPDVGDQDPAQGRSYEDEAGEAHPGQRIFSEALTPSGPWLRAASIRIQTVPVVSDVPEGTPLVTIYLKSFDVDDPALSTPAKPNEADADLDTLPVIVADNRGACGALRGGSCHASVALPFGVATHTTPFLVSSWPGDNYRVAASTSAAWLEKLVAIQPSAYGEVKVKEPNGTTMPLDEPGKDCVSEMLTVWRTLHLEMDATAIEPTDPLSPERNFLVGKVAAMRAQGGSPPPMSPNELVLMPQPTNPPLGLADGSVHLPGGSGRFENGTIVLGSGAGALTFPLAGNGADFVRGSGPFVIPFTLTSAEIGAPLTGFVLRWDGPDFVLSVSVPPSYVGGSLAAMGTQWTVTAASGTQVTVSTATEPPSFLLVDDDNAQRLPPFSSLLTEASDDPALNILAQAYVRPAYDLPGTGRIAAFRRNVPIDVPGAAAQQVADGRDFSTVHTPNHWATYLQGAFQGPASQLSLAGFADRDSDHEAVLYGHVPDFTLSGGALIFPEPVRDSGGCSFSEAMSTVVAHELGHLFDLRHSSGAIMMSGNLCDPKRYFSAGGLKTIRSTPGQ